MSKSKALITELIANVMTMRQRFANQLQDPRRDIDDECGYAKFQADPVSLYDFYRKEPLAGRVVEMLPLECWQVQPTVFEHEDAEVTTPWEAKWGALSKQLAGSSSCFGQEANSILMSYLTRLDVLCGIGQYGGMLIGIDDGLPLDQPVVTPAVQERKLLYLRVFPESQLTIGQYETSQTSPRFCQPVMYQVTLNDPKQMLSGVGLPSATVNVHWTRILHLADNLSSSEVHGTSRIDLVLHPLLDIHKVRGGSAEMYWRGALPGWALSTVPQLGGDVIIDEERIKDMMEEFSNGLQRYITLMGMSAQSLAPQVVDPTAQIAVQIEAICIRLGCPKRVFMGSERGELASSQDDDAWNDRLKQRQNSFITPRLIQPFVDRLVMLGVLPKPEQMLKVEWPDLTSNSAAQKADIAGKLTAALVQYISGNVQTLIEPVDFLTRFLGMTDDAANAMVTKALKAVEEEGLDQKVAA